MKIVVGSKNPVKVNAVREVIKDYPFLSECIVDSLDVNSGVSDHPMSLEEIFMGAITRAKGVFSKGCLYSFGIERGLIEIPYEPTRRMDVGACIIYDGRREVGSGLSCAFEIPPLTAQKVDEGMDLSQACLEAGLTKNEYAGFDEGIVGILTKGRVTREDYTKQAIRMALIPLDNPELYPTPQNL